MKSIIEDFPAIKARLAEIEADNPAPESKPEETVTVPTWMGIPIYTPSIDDVYCGFLI